MNLRPNVVLGWLGALVGSFLLGSCSSSTGTCVVGTESCPCFANSTCEQDLECVADTCRTPTAATGGGGSGSNSTPDDDDDAQPSGAGTNGQPTGGNAGASPASGGSSDGTGGTTSTGGAPTGGNTATGGESTSGGATASGGTVAAGGETAAGGTDTTGGAGATASGGTETGGTTEAETGGTTGAETGGTAGAETGGTTEATGGADPGGAGGDAGSSGADGSGGTPDPGVPLNVELVENGDFSAGDVGWNVSGGSGTYSTNGALCVSGEGGDNPLIGWPADPANGVPLAAGTTYALSFRFKGASTGFDVKVGGVDDPWPEVFRETELAETAADWASADLTVAVPADWGADSGGAIASGVAFLVWFSSEQMEFCIDDVSLMRVQ